MKIKKIFTIPMAIALVISASIGSFAAGNESESIKSEQIALESLKQDYQLIDLKAAGYEYKESELLKFDTVEEARLFFESMEGAPIEISAPNEMKLTGESTSNSLDNFTMTAMSSFTGRTEISQYKPYMNGSLFCWYKMFVNYTYANSPYGYYLTSINSVDSDIQGLSVYTYEHKEGWGSIDSSNVQRGLVNARGRGVFGVSIGGFTAGWVHDVHMDGSFTL